MQMTIWSLRNLTVMPVENYGSWAALPIPSLGAEMALSSGNLALIGNVVDASVLLSPSLSLQYRMKSSWWQGICWLGECQETTSVTGCSSTPMRFTSIQSLV